MTRALRVGAALLAAAAAVRCAPKEAPYVRPTTPDAAAWNTPAPWRPGEPRDELAKGAWWTVFHDDALDALEAQSIAANTTLEAAAARYEQARAVAALALSAVYPHVAAGGAVSSERLSGTRADASAPEIQNSFAVPLTVSYEVDLFGKRLKSLEAAHASLQASAADLENARLVVAAELAADYFSLRGVDAERELLDRTVSALGQAVTLVRNRYAGGIASGLDVAQEEALLDATRTEALLVGQQRDQLEHAIAVLAGQPASGFHVAPAASLGEPPAVDVGLPTALLERRPDVAAAERDVAAANARLGVARRAYFPSLTLLGSAGWQSGNLLKILDVPSMVWAVGAAVSEDVFTGGARAAEVHFAQADYDAAVATYRDAVLRALAEVEDDLSGLAVLAQAGASQAQTVDAASRALAIATDRYTGGLVTSLDVVSAQETLLDSQRLAVQIESERWVTTVELVKALGGGWSASALDAIK